MPAMSRFEQLPVALQAALAERRLLKVIAGLTNFDSAAVERISRAAGQGGGDLVDVACDPALVKLAARASGLPICVSAVDPELFPAAVAAGAAMVEIGNYDAFYPQGRIFGFMPHPEAYLFPYNHPQWMRPRMAGALPEAGAGLRLFQNAVEFAARELV